MLAFVKTGIFNCVKEQCLIYLVKCYCPINFYVSVNIPNNEYESNV